MKKFLFASLIFAQLFANSVIDMRGIEVEIPPNLERIATISDGFVESVMMHLGEIKKISAISSYSMKRDYSYTFNIENKKHTFKGWHVQKALNPWLDNLPCFNSSQGDILNYETLLASKPQLIILRAGDCTAGGRTNQLESIIKRIESLKIPLVVIFAPNYFKEARLDSMREEMRVIGEIFNKKDTALALYDYLSSFESLIKSRTKNIKNKTKVLNLGLFKNGLITSGTNTPESYIIESVANAQNAYRGVGNRVILNVEQIYKINPDIILLPTANGYHPSLELYFAPQYANLQNLAAIKNKKVYAMPWNPMNCARRLEYPLDMLIVAKAAYPKEFSDIKVHKIALELYQKLYHIDLKTAERLLREQILDWMIERDF